MTSYASLRSAVDSMKMGAVDYIAKPFDHDEMLQTVARILQDHQQSAAALAQPSRGNGSAPSDAAQGDIGIIGHCAPMQDLFSKIRKVAPTDSNVLIQGESGTGKELVARALHNLATGQGADDLGELRGHSGNLDRIRAVRPREGAFTGASAGRAGPSRQPMAAPCSSTKSANCHWKPRRACCAYCRKVRSAASARCSRRRSMCV